MLQPRCRCGLLQLQTHTRKQQESKLSRHGQSNILLPKLNVEHRYRHLCDTRTTITARNILFLIVGALLALPTVLTQTSTSDELYILPTPALHVIKGDLTTVLLVNNDKNGRSDYLGHYVSVRPNVGLLTSTARTFIQEGVTTEYATQVVGTTLDNGRLYAQYLKKTSRVLYDSGQQPHQTSVLPTAITSWVGDNLELQTKSLLESHNDLFNSDQPDWQDIDDRLLIDGGSAFVGNTDFVGLSEVRKKEQNLIPSVYPEVPTVHITTNFTSSSSRSSSSSSGHNGMVNLLATFPPLDENARESAANKVLPIGDLPTYTVRNHFSPSGFSTETIANPVHFSQHSVSGDGDKAPHIYKNIGNNKLIHNRSGKLYYQQLMGAGADIISAFKAAPADAFLNLKLSTTTYYGFADFTTIVGDSVIVFSPSTSTQNLKLGHVTSIKGKATLDPIAGINKSQVSTVAVIRNTAATAPTQAVDTRFLLMNKYTENIIIPNIGVALMPSQIPEEITSHELAHSAGKQAKASVADVVKSNALSSVQFAGTEADNRLNLGESQLTTNIHTLATYSRPSVQEVLEIYASLSRAEATRKSATQATTSPSAPSGVKMITEQPIIESNTIDMIEATLQSSELRSTEAAAANAVADVALPSISSSRLVLGGATTIFFEEDPFANFVEPTTTTKSVQVDAGAPTTETMDVSGKDAAQFGYETKATSSETTTEEYEYLAESTTIEPPEILNYPNNTQQTLEGEATRNTTSAPLGEAQPAEINMPVIQVKPTTKVSVLEINAEDDAAVVDDCIRTSQVFLTQIAQTVTQFNTLYESASNAQEGDDDQVTKIETTLLPTFDIMETTKHYCKKPEATTVVTATKSPAEHITKMQSEEEEGAQVDKPNSQDANAAEVTENALNARNTVSAPKASAANETISDELNESKTTTSATLSDVEYEEDANIDVNTESEDESGEEIELIYKTLYTTYTYLTTFFNAHRETSISSHTEVFTNVVTSTLDSGAPTAVNSQTAAGSLLAEEGLKKLQQEEDGASNAAGTSKFILPTELESVFREGEHTRETSAHDDDTITENSKQATTFLDNNKLLKTYLTTYTYYTTIFLEGETEIMSRTEVYTNYVSYSVAPTAVLETSNSTHSPKAGITKEFVEGTVLPSITSSFNEVNETSEDIANDHQLLSYSTMIRGHATSAYNNQPEPDLGNYTSVTLVNDVRSSSSNGDNHITNQMQDSFVADQISSESNTDEIRPSATLLLQTSFTTFTYYTTLYNNDATNVISSLETITNVATETLQASKIESVEEATLPITYFTTFTYWTKLANNGEITTLSRGETISNIVTPTALTPMIASIAPSIVLQVTNSTDEAVNTDNAGDAVKISSHMPAAPISVPKNDQSNSSLNPPHVVETIKTKVLEPTTYYTTYTYYTTSYDSERAITDSRFETITHLVTPSITVSDATPSVDEVGIRNNESNSAPNKGEESKGRPALKKETPVILYDYKKIIDSDGISTLHFTTEILPTIAADGSPSELISSTSSLCIDKVKKALLPSINGMTGNADGSTARQYKTGLVRLIEGTRIGNHTTTLYQSKVIGTFIENRYAQIIESTSSFIFEKNKLNGNKAMASGVAIEPTLTARISPAIKATQIATLDGPTVSISIADTGSEESATDVLTYGNGAKEDDEADDGDNNKARLPFQSKKRTFTPVIRPFASRNRPQFSPKKKSGAQSSATIITRLDFTPTITATPALKTSGRFSIRKGGIHGSPVSSGTAIAVTGSSSRRSFNRPIKPSQATGSSAGLNSPTLASSSGIVSGRNRLSSSAHPTLQSSIRRAVALIRPSSSGGFRSSFSTAYTGNSRGRIKPTGLGLIGQQNTASEGITTLSPDTSVEEESTTPELQPHEGENEEATADAMRRNQNPLLRFRRPIHRPVGFTPASQRASANGGEISALRNPLTARARTEPTMSSTTTTTPPRSFQRAQIGNIPGKSRTQNSLFPPRGLLQKQTNQEPTEARENKKEENSEGNADGDDDSEYDDEDEEDIEDDADGDTNRRRRSNTKQSKSSTKFVVLKTQKTEENTKAFAKSERLSRVRRETDMPLQRRSNLRNRFRRPNLTPAAAERNFTENVELDTLPPPTTTATRPRTNGHFASRYTGHHSTQAATTTTENTSSHRAIRPTRPTKGRAQFTLREKDTTTTQKDLTRSGTNNFRRPQTAASSKRASTPSTGNSRRLKSYNSNNLSQDTSSRSTVARGRHNFSRTRTTVRGRSRNDYNADPVVIPYDGTITVTHVIPAEVTIPVVNGKLTEYKNVVTAKTSTEVLGPQQYTTFVGGNGQTMLALTREGSSVNFVGATEITQYVLHESRTTTVIFTPTTIRGRKTSFSHVIPSTVYSVENVVSTSQPQISANAPLANILLSQLLLGNIGIPAANPLLGAFGAAATPIPNQLAVGAAGTPALATPVTKYRTHTSTYVTTVFEGMSTVLPVTFQGKKILTTIYDTSVQTITATEFVTDTIVTTPTPQPFVAHVPQVNSLLLQQLLLQQQLQPQVEPQLPILHSVAPQQLLADNLQDLDTNSIRSSNDNDNDIPVVEENHSNKVVRKKSRKSGKSHKRKHQSAPEEAPEGSSVITLYVSGRRPGEFSTILSTVPLGYESILHKRQAAGIVKQTASIDSVNDFYLTDGSELVAEYILPEELKNGNAVPQIDVNKLESGEKNLLEQTQSLDSIIGNVGTWLAKSKQAHGGQTAHKLLMATSALQREAFQKVDSRLARRQSSHNDSTDTPNESRKYYNFLV